MSYVQFVTAGILLSDKQKIFKQYFLPPKNHNPISPWAYDFGERKTLAILWNKHKCRNKDSFDEKWLKDPLPKYVFARDKIWALYNAVIGRYNAVHRNFGLKTL